MPGTNTLAYLAHKQVVKKMGLIGKLECHITIVWKGLPGANTLRVTLA